MLFVLCLKCLKEENYMFLHEDRDAFEYLLMNVSAATGIDDGILEKDWISEILG